MRIFINWCHYIGPKIFGVLSFMINPMFIFLVLTRSREEMGNYRYLLICFAVFDLVYSFAEMLTPLGFVNTESGFAAFLVDGPFSNSLEAGQHGVASRCFFISLSYGVLAIHFFYRYILLFKPEYVEKFFEPIGIASTLVYFAIQGASWTAVCESCLAANDEVRATLQDLFKAAYKVDSRKVGMLTAQYRNASTYVVARSWAGIASLTMMSSTCLMLYIFLGYKIVTKINSTISTMSRSTVLMHRQLFKALVVQTCIPTFVSFVPTVITWYAPIFSLNMGWQVLWWNNYVCTVALSAFPFIDPLAVICLIPSYKNAIFEFFSRQIIVRPAMTVSNSICLT